MPDDKKEAVLQLSARASSLDPADRPSVARLIGDLDALTGWIMSLPLDDEVQS